MPGGGSKPGERRGGRKKGTPNKSSNKINAAEVILKHKNPFEEIIRLATLAEQSGDLNSAISAYKELAKYCAPQRKAVEVTGEEGGPLEIRGIEVVGISSATDT